MKFEDTPIITPELVEADPMAAFAVSPAWALAWTFAADPAELADASILPPIIVVVGRKHRKPVTMTALQYAFLLEVNRLGHTVVTNSNFGKPVPKIYAKQSFRDAPEDNMPLARIFVDAGPNEAATTLEIASDLRIPNLIKEGAGKPTKHSLAVTMRHVERLAHERESGGTLPTSLNVAHYLENVRNLWDAIQREACVEA